MVVLRMSYFTNQNMLSLISSQRYVDFTLVGTYLTDNKPPDARLIILGSPATFKNIDQSIVMTN